MDSRLLLSHTIGRHDGYIFPFDFLWVATGVPDQIPIDYHRHFGAHRGGLFGMGEDLVSMEVKTCPPVEKNQVIG